MSLPKLASSSLRILAVDDAPTNRQILTVFLTKLGHTVMTAEDGLQAVERFAHQQPDLVLMDVMMPGMDGYEATRRIKAASGERWVPVIFLSALDKDENLVAGLDAGGDDYLTKPINFVVLDAKIRSVARTLEMQRNLDAARKQMASITNNIADGVITIDGLGKITWASHSAHAIFGFVEPELTGLALSDLLPTGEGENSACPVTSALEAQARTEGLRQCEVTGRRKNGKLFPLEIGISETTVDGELQLVGVMRDISERKLIESRLRMNSERLQRYYDEQEREHTLAQEILSRVMAHPGLVSAGLSYWISPASHFSGDVIAAMRRPDGRFFVMLADATGHGLAAAISALPLLTLFYGLVTNAPDCAFMVLEINRQLRTMLPMDRFVAATILVLDEASHMAEVWQGGMPEAVLLSAEGEVKARLESRQLPLGIIELDKAAVEQDMVRIGWDPGDQFALYSDGLIEARNRRGEVFDVPALLSILTANPRSQRLDAVRTALQNHLQFDDHSDDISLLLVEGGFAAA